MATKTTKTAKTAKTAKTTTESAKADADKSAAAATPDGDEGKDAKPKKSAEERRAERVLRETEQLPGKFKYAGKRLDTLSGALRGVTAEDADAAEAVQQLITAMKYFEDARERFAQLLADGWTVPVPLARSRQKVEAGCVAKVREKFRAAFAEDLTEEEMNEIEISRVDKGVAVGRTCEGTKVFVSVGKLQIAA